MPRFTLNDPKLLSLEKASRIRRRLRPGRKLVLTNGVFDLLHPGHTYGLARAKELAGRGGLLFVLVNSDRSVRALKGPSRPILGERARAYGLAQLRSVDGVVLFRRRRLVREIEVLRPDIYCKAGDYSLATLDPAERAALERIGARIEFLPFLPGFSTTGLVERIRARGG